MHAHMHMHMHVHMHEHVHMHGGQGRYTGFAVACCLDALFNIGAFMFLFGPRKCAHLTFNPN